MKTGDILFYTASPADPSIVNRGIAAAELLMGKGKGFTIYYHVALCVNPKEQIAALWPRIKKLPIDYNRSFDVYSVNCSKRIKEKAVANAVKRNGERYDLAYFCTFGLWNISTQEICSKLVYDSYKVDNFSLKLKGFITPQLLPMSKNIQYKESYRDGKLWIAKALS